MSDLTVTLNELAKILREEYSADTGDIVALARDTIEQQEARIGEQQERLADATMLNVHLKHSLKRIADMTDIEADFDGFEARQIASEALGR